MTKLRLTAGLVMMLLLVPLAPAHAQLVADDTPEVSGPLNPGKAKCSRDTVPNPSGEGADVARVKLCSWLIKFDPNAENDRALNYGFMWAQSTIRPLNGYCALRVETKIRLPYGKGNVYNRTPHRSIQIDAPRDKRAILRTAARGHSSQTGTATQTYRLQPRELEVRFRRGNLGRVWSTVWRGKTARKLGFVNALSTSWTAAEGAPTFVPKVNYRFVDPQHCPAGS